MSVLERIKALCEANNMKISTLEGKLKFSNGSLSKVENIPADRILKISRFFKVPMEEIMAGKDLSGDYIITKNEWHTLDMYRKISDVSKIFVDEYMRNEIRKVEPWEMPMAANTNDEHMKVREDIEDLKRPKQ